MLESTMQKREVEDSTDSFSIVNILNLSDENFIAHLISSEEAVKCALNNDDIRKKLDDIPELESCSISPKRIQTFPASCAALSILRLLYKGKGNVITNEQCTRSKELEIYSKIWQEPGGLADPQKIVSYFVENKLPIYCLEFEDITANVLSMNSSRLTFIYERFKKAAISNKNLIKINFDFVKQHYSQFTQSSFLITSCKNNDLHTVFAKTGKYNFKVIDPASKVKKKSELLRYLHDPQSNFVGVAFWMPDDTNLNFANTLTDNNYYDTSKTISNGLF